MLRPFNYGYYRLWATYDVNANDKGDCDILVQINAGEPVKVARVQVEVSGVGAGIARLKT